MKNIKLSQFNVYADNEKGEHFRAIACTEDNKRIWRLAKQNIKNSTEWIFCNNTQYNSSELAINDIDLY